MKYLILLTLAFFYAKTISATDSSASSSSTSNTTSTTNSTTSETAVNQTLLDNGVAAQKLLENSNQNKTPTSIKILSNGGSSSTTTSTNNLTDQAKQLSENYVDQGAANRIIEDKCKGEMAQACAGVEVDHKIMGMNPGIIKAVAQAYASFGAVSDSIFPLSKPTATPKNTSEKSAGSSSEKPADSSKDKPTDYCKYIPAATEAIAIFSQKNTIQGLNNGGDTSQKEVLLKAAKSHEGRAEQAQIQAAGWYGGAACYAVNVTLGKFAIDTSLIVKLTAATLLGTFYQAEVSANKAYSKKTRDVANSLPNKGDCNPVTQNDCYCAEPEHENDPNYCQAQIAKKNTPSAFSRVACTNNTLQIDPNCACEKSNSCFEKFLENQGAAELQLGMGYSNSPFKPIISLAHGKLEGGTLNSQAYDGTSAIAKKALNEISSKLQGNTSPLTPNQKIIADAIASKGIPANIARLMAQNSPPQSAVDKSMEKFSGAGLYQVANSIPGKSNVLDFSGGDGLGIGGKKGEKKDNSANDFLKKLNPKNAISNTKVLEFAEKAQALAPQITKSDKPLFEIISIRYQTSGRRLLQLDSDH